MLPVINYWNKMERLQVNINDSFFNGLFKEVWKKTIPPGLTAAEVDFIISEGNLSAGNKVLDLMSGYGRHSLELARKGCRVTAIDSQEDYIRDIEEATREEQLSITSIHQDITVFETVESFEAVICMGNSFSFFDKSQTESIIKKIGNWLQPGGVFIMNSWMVAEVAIRHYREKDWYYVDQYKYLLDYKYCFNPGRIESEQTIIAADGTMEINKAVDYIYSIDDLDKMASKQGLIIKGVYATPRKKKFSIGDGQVYIVAEKFSS
jgi:SAM-dependent methyltransferase